MASFMQGARLGAGLVGLGYGIYRMQRGRRDWMTTTAVTTGLSMTMMGLAGNRHREQRPQTGWRRLMEQVDLNLPMTVIGALR